MSRKKCLVILEYGIPHYREFIFDHLSKQFKDIKFIHTNERFGSKNKYKTLSSVNIKLFKGISLCIFNIFKTFNYDVIISTLNYRKPHTWIPFILSSNKNNWIFWGQGKGKSSSKIFNWLKKNIINKSLGYVVYTESGKNELIKIGVKDHKISVANNTLKVNNAQLTFGDDYLIYVGRLQERKGLDKVIRALESTKYSIIIVGDGIDEKNKLLKLSENLNLSDQVIFKEGTFDYKELKSLYSNAIAYISPDHVGLGVVQSFAFGVPVITCKNKAHAPEFGYCDETNSYLYEYDDELPSIIKKVYENESIRSQKKHLAYNFYLNNLHYDNVINAFIYHFKNLNNASNYTES